MNRNDDFDAHLRDVWRNSIDALPPAVARRLRPDAPEIRTPSRWPLGATLAAAAVLALAIGLRSQPAGPPQTVSAGTVAASSASIEDTTAPLDHSPDFYAWLASPDAEQLAME